MNRILIDTNIYSGALRGDQEIVRILRGAEHIGLSAISLGELFSGFKGGSREEEVHDPADEEKPQGEEIDRPGDGPSVIEAVGSGESENPKQIAHEPTVRFNHVSFPHIHLCVSLNFPNFHTSRPRLKNNAELPNIP